MQRNVVFLLIDCLRADMCWGEGRTVKTPNIDSLCRRGTTFTQAISTVPFTPPAVASILTGLYPFGHGLRPIETFRLNRGVKTLAEIFHENGYHTYAELTGPLASQTGLDKGFNYYHLRSKTAHIYTPWFGNLLANFKDKEFEEPYFIMLHFFELHQRLLAKEYDSNEFGRDKYERALSSFDAQLGELLNCLDDNTVIILHADHGEKIYKTVAREKFGAIFMRFYHQYRRLKRRFTGKQAHRMIFLSGHGFDIYDYLLRVPLVFSGKGIFPESKVISDQVRQIDIFPTLVEALGLKHDDIKIHGRSLLPLINGKEMPELPAYAEVRGPILPQNRWLAGIRTSKYKYIFAPYASNIPDELYDLEKDPDEQKNIATDQPEIAQQLRQELEAIQKADEKEEERTLSKEAEEELKKRLKAFGYLE